ncbi:MAG: hypothetical protein LBV71_01885 [Prevotella sp.]|nr:hypothetical protein [Prevotella sp.]
MLKENNTRMLCHQKSDVLFDRMMVVLFCRLPVLLVYQNSFLKNEITSPASTHSFYTASLHSRIVSFIQWSPV